MAAVLDSRVRRSSSLCAFSLSRLLPCAVVAMAPAHASFFIVSGVPFYEWHGVANGACAWQRVTNRHCAWQRVTNRQLAGGRVQNTQASVEDGFWSTHLAGGRVQSKQDPVEGDLWSDTLLAVRGMPWADISDDIESFHGMGDSESGSVLEWLQLGVLFCEPILHRREFPVPERP